MTIRRCKDTNDGTIQNTRTRMVGLLERNGWWDHWRDKDQDGGTIGETRTRMVGLLERQGPGWWDYWRDKSDGECDGKASKYKDYGIRFWNYYRTTTSTILYVEQFIVTDMFT